MLNKNEIKKLPTFQWMESRIPCQDALTAFIPDENSVDSRVQEVLEEALGPKRYYPVPGGHRVLIRDFDELKYDTGSFSIEKGVWDHEHCELCDTNIPALTLCYVTLPEEPYYLLCSVCFNANVPRTRLKEI